MEESEENSEVNEVAPQETESETHEEQREDPQERNWREMRQRYTEMEKALRERDEFIMKNFQAPKQQEPEEPDLPDDEYINYGGIKKFAQKAVNPLKKEIEELKAQLHKKNQQDRFESLRNRYPDFNDVVTQESIALFEQKEPELAEQIAKNTDPYEVGLQSYKYIKYSGILDEVPKKRRRKEVEEKIEKNSKTVQSPQAYEKRPMAQAFRMTKEEESEIMAEMMHFANQAGFAQEM